MVKLLIFANSLTFFTSHRKEIALAAINKGYHVTVLCDFDKEVDLDLKSKINFVDLPNIRGFSNFYREFKLLLNFYRIIKKIKPNIIHTVTLKPLLIGGFLSRFVNVESIVFAIPGMGSVYTSSGLVATCRKFFVNQVMRFALNHKNKKIICQNIENKNFIESLIDISNDEIILLPGAGVDLDKYNHEPMPNSRLTVTMASRLIKEKGVEDFVNAAKLLHERDVDVSFILAGMPDYDNPHSITNQELQKWKREVPNLKILGYCDDVNLLYSQSHIVCLPSYYAEGIPKTLIEGAACGRVILTTNSPGCRETFVLNHTGYFIEPKNPDSIAHAIETILYSKVDLEAMGLASREYAKKTFDVKIVVKHHMKIYEDLLSRV